MILYRKGQGALEFLFLIGGAILVAVIAITIITSTSQPAGEQAGQNSADAICRTRGIVPSQCSGDVTIGSQLFTCSVQSNGECSANLQGPPPACGDGRRNGNEQCEGNDLGGQNCLSFSRKDGTLACIPSGQNGECNFNSLDCTCGDNQLQGDDLCDGTNLNGKSCFDLTGNDGTLNCVPPGQNGFCTFDVTGCNDTIACGDGDLDTGEACDDGGQLPGDGCSATCQFETGYFCKGEPSKCGLQVTQCGALSGSSTKRYYLVNSVVVNDGAQYCFTLNTAGIELDCLNNTIDGTVNAEGGIRVNGTGSNSTVRDCKIIAASNFNGLWVRGTADSVRFEGNTVTVNGTGKAILVDLQPITTTINNNNLCGGSGDKSITINNTTDAQSPSSGNTCAQDACMHNIANSNVCKNVFGNNGNNDCDNKC